MSTDLDSSSQKRLKILAPEEIEALYERPNLTQDERETYFALTPPEKALLVQLHTRKSQLYGVLQMRPNLRLLRPSADDSGK